MAMTTRAKIILAGLAAATVIGAYLAVDRYVGAGNAAQGVRSVFVQDIGQKAQGLEAEIEKAEGAEGTEQFNPQLVSLLNRLYQAVPEENRLELAKETIYGLDANKKVGVLKRLYNAVPEENRLMLAKETIYGLDVDKKVGVLVDVVRQDYAVVSSLVRAAADTQLISPTDMAYIGKAVLGKLDEQKRTAVLSEIVAALPYTTTSQLTMSGLNGLNNADLFKAMSMTAGRIGERFKDSVGERFGGIFKLP
ncbi:hypothetical protein HYV82_02895 [Candidatus Woesearchaeota archaeon]|nr:hypothetical protein [Candidatus Woesearchaeota archaeon]